jgi:hypothetical protein
VYTGSHQLLESIMAQAKIQDVAIQTQLLGIAKEHFDIGTFEMKNSDRHDFREVSRRGMQAALEAAFLAGCTHAARQKAKKGSTQIFVDGNGVPSIV